jgi:phosphoenolpyruvate synthase/pyruvate phosphate dikinase
LALRGREGLLRAVQACYSSLFTDRAISHRARLGYDQLKVALSVGGMPMVRSDKASSGVVFTLDTESGFRDVMIPFCRTMEEGKRVIATMAANGLRQHEHRLEIYAMCEVPSNAVLAEAFLQVFDGFSIGSNDLTQLTPGSRCWNDGPFIR